MEKDLDVPCSKLLTAGSLMGLVKHNDPHSAVSYNGPSNSPDFHGLYQCKMSGTKAMVTERLSVKSTVFAPEMTCKVKSGFANGNISGINQLGRLGLSPP